MRLSCLPKVGSQLVDSRATLETAWLLQILAYVTQHTRCDLLTPFPCHLCVKEKCLCLASSQTIGFIHLSTGNTKRPNSKESILKGKGIRQKDTISTFVLIFAANSHQEMAHKRSYLYTVFCNCHLRCD